MENPPRIRPWSRLGSTIRVDPPATQPRPPPPSVEPSFIRLPTIFQTQPQPQPQPTQAPPAQAAPPAPMPVAVPPPPSPRPPVAPSVSSPPQILMPTSPSPKSPPQPSKTSVTASSIQRTSPPQPKANSPPQPKMTVPSPKPKSYSPPKPSSPPKQTPSAIATSSSFRKQATEEYFKITNPISVTTTTPPQSPKIKPFAPPPSPLTLPASQLNPVPEPESKTVVMAEHNIFPREEKDWKNNDLQRNSNSSIAAHNRLTAANGVSGGLVHQKKEKHPPHKKTTTDDHDEEGMRVITIAGENNGAYMDLGSSKNRANHQSPHLLQKNNPQAKSKNRSDSNSSSSDEGKSKKKGDRISSATAPPMKAFVNSNVQGVNNSILFNSTCAHSDPGVHLSFSKKPTTK